ncbi:hypothetical protein OE88DRAFT_1646440 [Heliocybe sulcata]|uniref:Uncharacterized protein n=1 Tax=Heliocybe sulcata TaxID=5364 RepID=A0A5C3MWT1_9AGAM|nr:hypothetical protein OE88DRAFT_1646440 [Heliocybe sulcata]
MSHYFSSAEASLYAAQPAAHPMGGLVGMSVDTGQTQATECSEHMVPVVEPPGTWQLHLEEEGVLITNLVQRSEDNSTAIEHRAGVLNPAEDRLRHCTRCDGGRKATYNCPRLGVLPPRLARIARERQHSLCRPQQIRAAEEGALSPTGPQYNNSLFEQPFPCHSYERAPQNHASWATPESVMVQHPAPHATTHHYTFDYYPHNERDPAFHCPSGQPATSLPLDAMQYPYPHATIDMHAARGTVAERVREDPLIGQDWLQGHNQQLVRPYKFQHGPIRTDEGGEPRLIANCAPRVFKFNPFEDEDDQAHVYLATGDAVPEPFSPACLSTSTTSALLMPSYDVKSTSANATEGGRSSAGSIGWSEQDDSCSFRAVGGPTEQNVKEGNGSSQSAAGILRRRQVTKGSRRLGR